MISGPWFLPSLLFKKLAAGVSLFADESDQKSFDNH
jgi:hypothetical protein